MKPLLILATAICCFGQAVLDPAKLLQPPTDSWPTYNGDYSGRRFSPLKKINQSNVNGLTLAWVRRTVVTGRQGGGGNAAAVIKGTPIVINGVMYYTVPDHAWAIDARTGREIWHYEWPSKGGWHIGNRGAAAWNDTIYFETPDCNLVALDMANGKERWRIVEDLRQSVQFTTANLMDPAETRQHGIFDVIFCRNVLIYFDDASRRLAAENLFACLAPGGFICLGHTESMSRISPLFEVRHFADAIVYQRPRGGVHG